jgi:spore germination cell wall hydrolase CwlJ-like protein
LLLLLLVAAPRAHAVVHPLALYYDQLGKDQRPNAIAELHCLALNVYHEARGEDDAGRLAVAAVTMNRVRSGAFPATVCDVVWQPAQFSWTKDGRPDRPYEVGAWREAMEVATRVYEYGQSSNVGQATFYHHDAVSPSWARVKRVVARVGRHLFYASKGI